MIILYISLLTLILLVIGLETGKIGRYISGSIFALLTAFFLVVLIGLFIENHYSVKLILLIYYGGMTWISGVLGFLLLFNKIKKKETNVKLS